MVQSTKVAALLRAAPIHRKLEEQIVDLLRMRDMTRLELADSLERSVNCVCAPVKALLDAGVVKEQDRVPQRTGRIGWTLRLQGDKRVL